MNKDKKESLIILGSVYPVGLMIFYIVAYFTHDIIHSTINDVFFGITILSSMNFVLMFILILMKHPEEKNVVEG